MLTDYFGDMSYFRKRKTKIKFMYMYIRRNLLPIYRY